MKKKVLVSLTIVFAILIIAICLHVFMNGADKASIIELIKKMHGG